MSLIINAAGAAVGAASGHLIRRATPHILRLRDKSLPFAGPWVELATAIAATWVVALHGWLLPALLLSLLLIAACAADYLAKLVPDAVTIGGTLVGVLTSTLAPGMILGLPLHGFLLSSRGWSEPIQGVVLALAGALLGLLLLEAVRLIFSALAGMQVMGMGDSKLLMMIGAFLGPIGAVASIMIAFVLGVIHGIAYLKIARQPHSPFAPPLAMAAWLVMLDLGVIVRGFGWLQRQVLRLPLTALASIYTLLIAIAVVALLRARRRAAEYEQIIEDDYRQVEERLE